jgi:predicted permease
MARLLQDVLYGARTAAKSPGFTAVAVLVLGVGIGANTAIFTFVNELLFRPLSGRAGDLVGLYSHDRTTPNSYRSFSYPNYADIRAQSDIFESVMAHTFTMVGLPAGDTTRRSFASVVSSNYFETLGVPLAAGRAFTAEEERPGARIPVVVVTHRYWKNANFDPGFIGSTIRVNAQDFTVVGVTPEGFTGTMALFSAELYLPLGMFEVVVNDIFKNTGRPLSDRANTTLILAGTLEPGVSDAVIASKLEAMSRQLESAHPAENKNQLLTVSPLSRLSTSTSPQTDGGMAAFTALLLTLSGVVLIIACLNVANMLLARGTARRKEIALRLALGAKRSRVVRQLLTESVMLAVAGAALGLLFAYWATRGMAASLAAVMPLPLTVSSRPDALVLLATIGFAALSTIAFGLGPALKLSRRDLVTDLKDLGADSAALGRRFGARNLMVVGQVALSLALLTAGGIFARAALVASKGDPGFRYDRISLASLDVSLAAIDETKGRAVYADVLERTRALAGVEAVSFASTLAFGDMHDGRRVERMGAPASDTPASARTFRIIGADYFATLGVKMVRGREFTRTEESSATAPRVAIIDEALARRLFGDEDPIGRMIRIPREVGRPESSSSQPMQVVGIAPPMKDELLDRGPVTHLYVPFGQHYRTGMHVLVRAAPGAQEQTTLDAVRATLRDVDARLPVLALSTMKAFHERGLELWGLRAGSKVFTGLGVLALLLSVVGVYGVRSYVVSQRTREIGIRMALGASPREVIGLVLREGLLLTGAGVAIGLPLAILVSVAMTKVFVDIGGFDPVVVATAAIALALSATIASAVPARRAAGVVLVRALRAE